MLLLISLNKLFIELTNSLSLVLDLILYIELGSLYSFCDGVAFLPLLAIINFFLSIFTNEKDNIG